MTIMPKVTPAWKVYVSRKLVYIWNMSTRRSTTYVYVRTREKMWAPRHILYNKVIDFEQKNDHCVTIFRLEAFGAVVSPKLPHYLMKERDKGPESYTPVCHHLKQKCKFRDSCSLPYCMYIVKCYHNVQTTHLLLSGI